MREGRFCGAAMALLAAMAAPMAAAQTLSARFEVIVEIDGEKAPAWAAPAARLGSLTVASSDEKVTLNGDRYVIESNALGAPILSKVFDNLRVVRRSEGAWVSGGQSTVRYSEKRGSSQPASAVFDARAGTVRFTRGPDTPARVEAVKFVTTDIAALPYVFLGRSRPAGPVTFAYTDGRTLRTVTLDPTVVFNHVVLGKPVPTVRYVSRRTRAKDADLELWIRAEDGFPVRLRIASSRYGGRAELNPTLLPPPLRKAAMPG